MSRDKKRDRAYGKPDALPFDKNETILKSKCCMVNVTTVVNYKHKPRKYQHMCTKCKADNVAVVNVPVYKKINAGQYRKIDY